MENWGQATPQSTVPDVTTFQESEEAHDPRIDQRGVNEKQSIEIWIDHLWLYRGSGSCNGFVFCLYSSFCNNLNSPSSVDEESVRIQRAVHQPKATGKTKPKRNSHNCFRSRC
jgi:hypothetical protein